VEPGRHIGVSPFLKWAGGKRALLPELHPRFPSFSGKYIEPFLGAGAVFFSLPLEIPKIVSDTNEELVNAYLVVRDSVDDLILELEKHKNQESHFYEVRSWDRDDSYRLLTPTVKAARFIYLNRTCYNGLHRVNARGEFNVPFGKYKNPKIVPAEELKLASNFLNTRARDGTTPSINSGDYRLASRLARSGDFVYFDPPYDPISTSSNFVSYTSEGFNAVDQIELRDETLRLASIGVSVMVSNSDTEFIREIYGDEKDFDIDYISSRRRVASRESHRQMTQELVITNQPSVNLTMLSA
jgi:DNA adenine methylase